MVVTIIRKAVHKDHQSPPLASSANFSLFNKCYVPCVEHICEPTWDRHPGADLKLLTAWPMQNPDTK